MIPWQIRPSRIQLSITYCLSFTLFGFVVGSLGPIIPIKSLELDVKQTDLGIAFALKGIGGLIASILAPSFEGMISLNRAVALSCAIIGISSANLGATGSLFMFCCDSFAIGVAIMVINIMTTVSIIRIHSKQSSEAWIKALHLSFGIGAFIAPQCIHYLGLDSFKLYPILAIVLTLLLVFFHYPASDRSSTMQEINPDQEIVPFQKVPIPPQLDTIIALFMFVYAGFQVAYWGWINTFAFQSQDITPQQSMLGSTLFWIAMTVGRAISIPLSLVLSTSKQLLVLISMALCTVGVALLLLVEGKDLAIIYYISISMGICCSGVYPLMMNFPNSVGMRTSTANTSKYALGGSIGQAVLPFLAGQTIYLFGRSALFGNQVVLGGSLMCLFLLAVKLANNAVSATRNPTEMSLLKGQHYRCLDDS